MRRKPRGFYWRTAPISAVGDVREGTHLGVETSMSGTIKRRILSLERSAKAIRQQIQFEAFEAIHLSDEDERLLDAIAERGEPETPEEQAALNRFTAQYEAA